MYGDVKKMVREDLLLGLEGRAGSEGWFLGVSESSTEMEKGSESGEE